MPDRHRFSLLHDNASCHTSAATTQRLTQQNINVVPNYPAHSPDFNAMEKVWAWLKMKVKRERPTNGRMLKNFIHQAWNVLPASHRQNYIRHVQHVMQQVIAVRGWHT
jgi:hypothetical protein